MRTSNRQQDRTRPGQRPTFAILVALLSATLALVGVPSVASANTGGTIRIEMTIDGSAAVLGVAIDQNLIESGAEQFTTAPVPVSAGAHSVGLAANGPSGAGPFVTNWECRDANGSGSVIASGERISSLSVDVSVADGQEILCQGIAALRAPGMAVSASESGGPYGPGDNIEYTIGYANTGNVAGQSVIINVWVPLHTTGRPDLSPGFTCSPIPAASGANCTRQLPVVPTGESGSVTFVVTVGDLDPGVEGTTFYVGCLDALPGQCDAQPGIRTSNQFPEADLSDNYANVTSVFGDPDADGDGVPDAVDVCPETDLAADTAPRRLKRSRFWSDADGNFGRSGFTVADTGGCSASQIIEAAGLGRGHEKFGISRGELRRWVRFV